MRRHRTDGLSLVFGVLFLAASGSWLAARVVRLDSPQVGWAVAIGLIALGLLGLIGVLRSGRREVPAGPSETAAGPGEAAAGPGETAAGPGEAAAGPGEAAGEESVTPNVDDADDGLR